MIFKSYSIYSYLKLDKVTEFLLFCPGWVLFVVEPWDWLLGTGPTGIEFWGIILLLLLGTIRVLLFGRVKSRGFSGIGLKRFPGTFTGIGLGAFPNEDALPLTFYFLSIGFLLLSGTGIGLGTDPPPIGAFGFDWDPFPESTSPPFESSEWIDKAPGIFGFE